MYVYEKERLLFKFVCGLFDMRNKNNVSSYVHVGGDPKPRTRTNEKLEFRKNDRMRKRNNIKSNNTPFARFLSDDDVETKNKFSCV